MEILREAPKASTFVPLAEHQSTTPASFYEGPPVLHYYSDRCKLITLESDLSNAPALANLFSKAPTSDSAQPSQINGHDSSQKVLEDLDVWVTSDKLFVFSNSLNTGLSIPYPSISLHAIQSQPEPSTTDTTGQGLYMQLAASTGNTTQSEDLEPESISITIVPTASVPPTDYVSTDEHGAEIQTEAVSEQTPVAAMFTALSNCSNLHPDPVEDEDMDEGEGITGSGLYQSGMVLPGGANGGLPPPMPGSGGWITAENMHEFFDEQGNWIGPEDDGMDEDGDEAEPLGPGAGTTRQRDGDGDIDNGADDETKWRRTK